MARAQQACVLRLIQKDSERSGALARATQKPAGAGHCWHMAPWPRGEGRKHSRRCSAISWCIGRPRLAWHGARAASLRAAPSSERQRAKWQTASEVARSRVPRESRLVLGGHRWHGAPRPRAEAERPLAGAVPSPTARTNNNRHSTVRAGSKLACCAFFRPTESAVARSRAPRENRLILGGRSWHVAPRPRADGRKDSRRCSDLA